MRYLVIAMGLGLPDEGPEEFLEYKDTVPIIHDVTVCKDAVEVADALKLCRAGYDCDWAVYEVVGVKTERRAIIFKSDDTVEVV